MTKNLNPGNFLFVCLGGGGGGGGGGGRVGRDRDRAGPKEIKSQQELSKIYQHTINTLHSI